MKRLQSAMAHQQMGKLYPKKAVSVFFLNVKGRYSGNPCTAEIGKGASTAAAYRQVRAHCELQQEMARYSPA